MNKFPIVYTTAFIVLFHASGQDKPFSPAHATFQEPHSGLNETSSLRRFHFRAMATFDFGNTRDMPFWPEELDIETADGSFPASGYGIGISSDYRLSEHISLVIALTNHNWRFRVARKGLRSASDWIMIQTDSVTRYTDTWDRDVFFSMHNYDIRFSTHFIRPISEHSDSWLGIGAGITPWNAIIAANDQIGNYGRDKGTGLSLFIQIGFDFTFYPAGGNNTGIILSPFVETGYTPAKNIEMDNLYLNGWTWRNARGEFAVLPFRLGMAITMF